MNTAPIKIAVTTNTIFLLISFVALSNAYYGSYKGLSLNEEKIEKIESTIANETEIEKLRNLALVSFAAQNNAYETIDSAIEASSKAIKLFSFMFAFNVLFLLIFLYKCKKKSNQSHELTF